MLDKVMESWLVAATRTFKCVGLSVLMTGVVNLLTAYEISAICRKGGKGGTFTQWAVENMANDVYRYCQPSGHIRASS